MRGGYCSEYGRLTAVLLHRPGADIGNHPEPAAIQQLRPIDPVKMEQEFSALLAAYAALGVTVALVDPTPLSADRRYRHNLMFCRDLFFMTPAGAILASMANDTRRGEVRYAARTLEHLGIPIVHRIDDAGRFEGADALWLSEKLVAVGVGNRTNEAAFGQIGRVLAAAGIDCIPLPSTQTTTQHLLGSLQIVDRDLALVREEIIAPAAVQLLRDRGFTVVGIPENAEVRQRQALNVVTVAPRTVIMTAGCPQTKALYRQAGIVVAAELEISQLINGAGGLACATGIISREDSFDDSRSYML